MSSSQYAEVLAAELTRRFAALIGPENTLTDPEAQAPYLREWRGRYYGRTPAVLRPANTDEVSHILALAHEYGAAIVPQSGNTGLVGGQIPSPAGNEFVLSLERLCRVREIAADGSYLIAEAGLTLAEVQRVASERGRLFPLSMASEGSARLGGALATNAGGVAVLAHGTARNLVLGLEAVLADGAIWNGLRTLKKDNTGYDLKDLFIGSEGTLGVITAAALKLFPRPAATVTAFAALENISAVETLFHRAQAAAGPQLTGFEFMARIALDFSVRHIPGSRPPFSLDAPWYVLIELSSHRPAEEALATLETLLVSGEGVREAVVAQSLAQAQGLWQLRESLSEAQKYEGGSIKHDVSVPVPAIPGFLARADALVTRLCPGARPVAFGHFGDGNVHYNISQPVDLDTSAFLALWEPMQEAVHALVAEMGGSISAEHGIGQMKREALARLKDPVELALMRRVKAALDPKGILNPGKLL